MPYFSTKTPPEAAIIAPDELRFLWVHSWLLYELMNPTVWSHCQVMRVSVSCAMSWKYIRDCSLQLSNPPPWARHRDDAQPHPPLRQQTPQRRQECFKAPEVRREAWRNSAHGGNISLAFIIGETWLGLKGLKLSDWWTLCKACSQGLHELKHIHCLKILKIPLKDEMLYSIRALPSLFLRPHLLT